MATHPLVLGAGLDDDVAAYVRALFRSLPVRFVNVAHAAEVPEQAGSLAPVALTVHPSQPAAEFSQWAAECRAKRHALRIVALCRSVDESYTFEAAGADHCLTVADLRALPNDRAGELLLQHCAPSAAPAEQGSPAPKVPHLIGGSPAMREIAERIQLVAPRTATVLIRGRTGTGKELVARALQALSPRATKPFVVVNCGAIPENLVESELFGHTRGAFTGAQDERKGSFEIADGGTLFLDEVGELPLDAQSKLLRTLQEREVQRVGSSRTIPVDVRVIAATNRDLAAMVQTLRFREDLYYRLNVVCIELPRLSERREDIPLLVDHLLGKICRKEQLPVKRVHPEALAALTDYPWPGNIRELENTIEAAVALSGERASLAVSDFRLPDIRPQFVEVSALPDVRMPPSGLDFDHAITALEQSLLHQALDMAGGNKRHAADLLGLKRTTFAAKLKSADHRRGGTPSSKEL